MSVQAPLGAISDGAALELGTALPARAGLRPRRSGPARPPAARAQVRVSQGTLALGGLLAMGLLISLSAAQTDLLLPQPLRTGLAGVFGHVGLDIGLGGIIAALALMFCSYALALKAAEQLSARAVLLTILALNVLVLVAPPLFSTDIFSYIAYAREGSAYGVNPYLHGPSAIVLDQVYPYIGMQWVNTPTAYGPLFSLLSYPLAGLSIAANVFSYKAVAALSSLAIVLLVWRAARLRGLDPVKAVALVGLNPVLIVYGVGGGHNDLLMLALLVAAVYVLLIERGRTGGAMIVAAMAVKLTAGVVLPFALAMSAGRREGSDSRRQILIGAGVTLLAVSAMGAALFGIGPLHLIGTLHTIQDGGGPHSVPGFILTVVGLDGFAPVAGLLLDAIFLGWLAWLVRRVYLGRLDWITGAGWATVGLLLTAGLLMPWYVVWLLPLAALSSDRRLRIAAIALTALGLTSL
jgi:alpha-1,6-mannosyltransferase